MLDLQTLLRVPIVDWEFGFNVSPDGEVIAFSWNLTGNWELYLLNINQDDIPHPITRGSGAKFAPRWSPDGKILAYVLDEDGNERCDIYLYDSVTGFHTNLTPNTNESIQPEVSWSPDGGSIAYASDRSGKFEAYVMSSDGGDGHCLVELPYPVWKVHWSPDGKWIAVLTVARGQDYYTYIVPAQGGDAIPINHQGEPICAKDLAWSPDGKQIAFSSNLSGYFQIGFFDLQTRQIAWLAPTRTNQEMPVWSPDGRLLIHLAGHGPKNTLALHDLETSETRFYQASEGVHYRPVFMPGSCQVVFAFDNPAHPCDLWLLALDTGQLKQLTQSLPVELQETPFVIPEEIEYRGLDGCRVPALLYQPADNLPAPAVVYIHGGPNWHTHITWDALVQHMVSRGWGILAPNYRGSTGYGREWQLANRFDLGGGDTRDVVGGADFLVSQGIADPHRIALTGRSYGGYLTMTSLTGYPDRWVGGSAVVPFLNWFTGHENSREDLQHWDLENFGDPLTDHDLYYERSPFFFLDRILAPVQLICGAHDPRCPASESLQARDALLAMAKSCDFVLYPDEGHVFLKTDNQVDAKKRQVDFLAALLEAGDSCPTS